MFKLILMTFLLNISAVEQDTISLSKKMLGLIQQAKDCSIKKEGSGVRLCTGILIEKKDIDFFKSLDMNRCEQFITQLGYQVYDLEKVDITNISKDDLKFKEMLSEFNHSTKLAYIDYSLKTVLFKASAEVGDCIHEIIHFYQHNRPSRSELYPENRNRLREKLQSQLEKEVIEVENWEKKGDVTKAQELAGKLAPLIQLQREWVKLIDWLDEKEVYEFMFDYYGELGLKEKDFDIAVSNLVRYQYALDWRWLQKVLYFANQLLNQKYAKVVVDTKAKYKSENEYNALYTNGKISREEFEEKVIALRKLKALKEMESAKEFSGKLKAKIRGRFYERVLPSVFKGSEFSYQEEDSLPFVTLDIGHNQKVKMLIDLGAQQSIIHMNHLKQCHFDLIGEKKIQTGHVKAEQAPVIQLKEEIKLGEVKLQGAHFALSESPLFMKYGVLGIDFFRDSHKAWNWDFKNSQIKAIDHFDKGAKLSKNGLDQFDALEFKCMEDNNVQTRIDTGSQVYGDYRKNLSQKLLAKCTHSSDKLNPMNESTLYFSRGVDINLGFPYLKESYTMMSFDLERGRIALVPKKP